MPGATPVFGIRYPVMGDPITTTVFQDEATDIEAAVASVDALATARLNRPYVVVFGSFTAVIAVETVVTWTGEGRDTDNMFTLGAPTVLTVNTPGVYLVTANMDSPFATTITAVRTSLLRNGVVQYAQSKRSQNNGIGADTLLSGLISCAAGDTLQVRFLWTGTGGPASSFSVVSACLVCSV